MQLFGSLVCVGGGGGQGVMSREESQLGDLVLTGIYSGLNIRVWVWLKIRGCGQRVQLRTCVFALCGLSSIQLTS